MQQISQIVEHSEKNYTLIEGGTGPLVYPGGHVAIYTLLWALTNKGQEIQLAQYIFLIVYVLTLALVIACVYRNTELHLGPEETLSKSEEVNNKSSNYKPNKLLSSSLISLVPPYLWALPLLCLSKRLHSIYMLRLFNDCFGTLFSVLFVSLMVSHRWILSSIVLSVAVSIKMNSLLYIPGAAVIYLQAVGLKKSITRIAVPFILVQMIMALPFIFDLTPLTQLVSEKLECFSLQEFSDNSYPELSHTTLQMSPEGFLESLKATASNLSKSFAYVYRDVSQYLAAFFSVPLAQIVRVIAKDIRVSPYALDYVKHAFDFSRVFMYKWTVNWRFIPEDIFISPLFGKILLALHLTVILAGFATHKSGWWFSPLKPLPIGSQHVASGPSTGTSSSIETQQRRNVMRKVTPIFVVKSRSDFTFISLVRALFLDNITNYARQKLIKKGMDKDYILKTLISSNLIGILFARSLHYQFYSWFYWSVPYALYVCSTNFSKDRKPSFVGVILSLGIWISQEIAWLTYPSTSLSSLVVIFSLAYMVAGLWYDGYRSYNLLKKEAFAYDSQKVK